jgi:hypothetical protein
MSAKIVGVVTSYLGLVAGILYSFGGFFYELITGTLNDGTVLAFGALVGMPIIFGTVGVLGGAVGAIGYNFISRIRYPSVDSPPLD